MEHRISDVGVLDKAVLVLDALQGGPLALGELVAATGLARATAHRLAVGLERHGLVRRDAQSRFALGFRLTALARAAAEGFPLAATARPALEWLRAQTGESVQLYVLDGERRVCAESLESPHGLRTIVAVGSVLPLERGSAGAVLRGAADQARRAWVQSVGEREPGVASVSAPVLDGGTVVAAVSVSGPIERTTRQPGRRYGAAVVEAAERVSQAAGFRTPSP